MRAMRIVVIGPAPPLRGGIAKHTAGLAGALRRRGHVVEVVSYSRLYPRWGFPGRSQTECAKALGAPILDTLDPRSWRRTRAHLAALAPDLIVAQWWHPVAAPALTSVLGAAPAPVAAVCHNALPHERLVGARPLLRRFLGCVSHVVCHSRAVAADIVAYAPHLVPQSVGMPLLIEPPQAAPAPAATRRSALLLGCVRWYKGPDVLLRAWSRARLPPGATLTIAGESYLGRGRLERLVAREKCSGIRLLDRYLSDDEVRAALTEAAVLVLPYVSASQSGVLPLALAAGLRVIVSDVGGLAEPVAGDDRHYVVPPRKPALLATCLEAALRADPVGRDRDGPARRGQPIRDIVDRSWEGTVRLLLRIPFEAAAAGSVQESRDGRVYRVSEVHGSSMFAPVHGRSPSGGVTE